MRRLTLGQPEAILPVDTLMPTGYVVPAYHRLMQLIGIPLLEECKRKHADVRGRLDTWREDMRASSWRTPVQLRNEYVGVELVGPCAKFKIKGGSYRLIARVNYQQQLMEVLWVGTHSEYDKIDAEEICEEAGGGY